MMARSRARTPLITATFLAASAHPKLGDQPVVVMRRRAAAMALRRQHSGRRPALGADVLVACVVGVVGMKGQQIVGDTLCVRGSAEDFALISLQGLYPGSEVACMVRYIAWQIEDFAEEYRRQLGTKLFLSV